MTEPTYWCLVFILMQSIVIWTMWLMMRTKDVIIRQQQQEMIWKKV